jgi:hypothetical protein
MNLGLYAIRTVTTPPVRAHNAPKALLPKPKLSMAEDAKICNRRAALVNGQAQCVGQNEYNAFQSEQSRARYEGAQAKIYAALADHKTMTRSQIVTATGLSMPTIRRALEIMQWEAKVEFRKRNGNVWALK